MLNLTSLIKPSLIAGIMGFIMSFLMNYFIVPMPDSVVFNAFGNGISGFISGFFGVVMFLITSKDFKLK